MNFSDFPLGSDTAWTLITVIGVSVLALALPFLVFRRRPERDALGLELSARIGAAVSEAARGSLWSGAALALAVAALPGSVEARWSRAGMLAVGVVLGIAVAWRTVSLAGDALASTPRERLSRAHLRGAFSAATGAAASAIVAAILVWITKQDAGQYLLAATCGFAIVGLGVRASAVVSGVGHAAASHGVAALEQEESLGSGRDSGRDLGATAAGLAAGPLRALDVATLAAFIPGVIIVVGVPLLGTASIITALVVTVALLLAHLLPSVLPFAGKGDAAAEVRTRALGATLAGAVPALGALAALALWLPSDYAKLRMRQVGLADFTDPMLISLFVDPAAAQQGQVPSAINRDTVEPHIKQMASGFEEFYKSVGDAPDAQSVMDTIVLHTINPSQVTALALAVGLVFGLASAAVFAFVSRRYGIERLRHVRGSHVSTTGIELSGLALGVPVAVLALLGFAGAWVLTTAAAGIAYLALYLAALAAAALAVVGAGYTSLVGPGAGADVGTLADSAQGNDAGDRINAVTRGARTARVLVTVLNGASATLAAFALLAPLGGEIRAAKKALHLWDDRSLRTLVVDSPTVIGGIVLGVLVVGVSAALVADPIRRVLASVTAQARAEFASDSSVPEFQIQHSSLGGDSRRIAAVVLAAAVMGPLVSGFGLGAASMSGYVIGSLIAGFAATTLAAFQELAASRALLAVESRPEGSAGGPGSLAHVHALGAEYGARVRGGVSQLAGASGLGAFALLTALSAHLSAPLVIQFATDGTNPWIRAVAVVAALLVIAGSVALARQISEPSFEGDEFDSEPLFEVAQ